MCYAVVIAIAAGGLNSLALKSDGTVVAWGAGAPNDPSDPFGFGQSTVPAGLGGIVAIAAGDWQCVALYAPPSLAAPLPLPGGSAELTLTGTPGLTYTVQASADLANWTPLGTVVATNALTGFTDAGGTNLGHRFYRAVMP
jgi:hypothetical protein